MKQITQVKKVLRGTGAELSDSIQSHVRSLETKGFDKGHFGALLILMIHEKIPEDVNLLIVRCSVTANLRFRRYLPSHNIYRVIG